jgi:alginate O-acetyltransferase complex protein AlgI
LAYYFCPGVKSKNIALVGFSLFFYAWGEPVWVILLLTSAFVDWCNGLWIRAFGGSNAAKLAVINSLVINLGILIVFKYSGFLYENINAVFGLHMKVPNFALPVGISFYTFQTISYTIDCYNGTVKPQRSFWKYLMYISMFPCLVAGPIVRYNDVAENLSSRRVSVKDMSYGFSRIALGLAKKVIISNNLSVIVDSFFGTDKSANISELSVLGTWYGAAIFAMQVYFDFSGYSDMAIGLARLFGFKLNENFKDPFMCKDISDFWRRWHISLGSFFRDYLLYLPIFGKRRKYGGLMLVWFCTGIWHGASWNYIIWGLWFGVWIMAEVALGKKRMKRIPQFVKHVYSKIIVVIGFGIFFFEDMTQLGDFLLNLVGANGNVFADDFIEISFMNNLFLIIIAVIMCLPIKTLIGYIENDSRKSYAVVNSVRVVFNLVFFAVSSIMLVDATNNPFLYFRF